MQPPNTDQQFQTARGARLSSADRSPHSGPANAEGIVVACAQSPLIRAIDDLVASGKIDRFPLEIEVIPYLTDAFGSTPDEAVETLREWERRKGRG